jgi:hypothetical protein
MSESEASTRLSFNISIANLVESLRILGRADVLKLSIMQQNNVPILRIRSPNTSAVQDISIVFHEEFTRPGEFTIPQSVQASVSHFG